MSGGEIGNIKFQIVETGGTGALMVITQMRTGLSKEYPLTLKDLYRLQDEVQGNIIHCTKKAASESTTHLEDIRRVGI